MSHVLTVIVISTSMWLTDIYLCRNFLLTLNHLSSDLVVKRSISENKYNLLGPIKISTGYIQGAIQRVVENREEILVLGTNASSTTFVRT